MLPARPQGEREPLGGRRLSCPDAALCPEGRLYTWFDKPTVSKGAELIALPGKRTDVVHGPADR